VEGEDEEDDSSVFSVRKHWIGGEKGGGNTEGAPKKDFGAIPYFLVIADYEKAFLYVVLK
jgi:hypothetical protein